MNSHKGTTLVEVVVGAFLISLIAVFLLRSLWISLTMMATAKEVTREAYNMMADAQDSFNKVKSQLSEAETPEDETIYSLFSTQWGAADVRAYPRRVDCRSYFDINLVVGLEDVPKLPVPWINSLNIFLSGDSVRPADKGVSYYFSGAGVESNITITTPPSIPEGTTTYRWYVSNPGFNIASNLDSSGEVAELLNRAPVFPDDYTIITSAGVTNNSLDVLKEEYAGRHIVLVAVPSSGATGKMGQQALSNTVFISGLPATASDSLLMHFDASVRADIDSGDEEGVYKLKSGGWEDLSGNGYKYYSVLPRNINSMDVSTENGDIYARYVTLGGVEDKGTILTKSPGLKTSELSVFTVARADKPGTASEAVLATANIALFMDHVSYWNGSIWETAPVTSSITPGEWYVVGARIREGELTFLLNGEIVARAALNGECSMDMETIYLGLNPIKLHSADMSLAEILMYKQALSDADYSGVGKYLAEKYAIS